MAEAPRASAEIERLEKRLERARRARQDAEHIAERVTRDLYQRQAALEMLEAVAAACNRAAAMEEAMQATVDAVCDHTGWPIGHVYVLEHDSNRLAPTGIWRDDGRERFQRFRELTEASFFARGEGLPGRVLESGAAAWIIDVRDDPNFPRSAAAIETGLRAAFAFPVTSREEVLAVLEFFSNEEVEPNEALLALMTHAGSHLGRALERAHADEERARLGRETEALLVSAGEGIYGIDADGRTTFVNPAAAKMLGRARADMIGMHVHDLVHQPTGGTTAHSPQECPFVTRLAAGGASRSGEDVFWRADGTSFPVEYIRTGIRENGTVRGAVLTFKDVTDRKRFESQLRYVADHDALTGLFNRRRFEEELTRQLAYAQRYGGGATLMLDIDNFKYVNDSLGHHAGDQLIQSVAGLLRDRLRSTDVIARLGGDEFAVLLPQTGVVRAEEVADELLKAFRAHTMAVADQPIRVSTSIGVAPIGAEKLTAEEILVEADIAMYQAKEAGRDRVIVYTPEHGREARIAAGMTWNERITDALEHDKFVLYCQPIIDLTGSGVSQYEVLLRMRDEDKDDVILPGAFLPPAERFGLIREIDRWVVREAIRLLERLRQSGRQIGLLLEINLSGKSIGDPELPALIERELANTQVDPAKLIFEITETAAIANMEEARRFAEMLTQQGCQFALDDFGAGFGSFYYLKYLPLHYLKIDGDFIENLVRSPVDQRLVKAMVEVARGLEMKTIAEFVSDDESIALLRESGVDFAQGFHIGVPRPVSELALDD